MKSKGLKGAFYETDMKDNFPNLTLKSTLRY